MNNGAAAGGDDVFGPVISCYTRAQALEDGVLVDVSDVARQVGFKIPVAMTRGLWSHVEKGGHWNEHKNGGATLEGVDSVARVVGILREVVRAVAGCSDGEDRVYFVVQVGGEAVDAWALCGPGDSGEPVVTVMLRGED